MEMEAKTVLFRKIARIFILEKPCYLENCAVREPCKRRTACTCNWTLVLSFSYLVITVSSFRNRSIFKSQSTHILHIKIACKFLQIPIQSAFFCKFIDPQWKQSRFKVPFFLFKYFGVVGLRLFIKKTGINDQK